MKRILLLLVLLLALGLPSPGATATWDASTDPSVTTYKLYYGTATGQYTTTVNVGNVTSRTVTGLTPGVTYFFVVTALNAAGLESLPSNEASFTQPSNTATLTDLSLTAGTLVPVFTPGATAYAASVANTISTISVRPTASNATITVNGMNVQSGALSPLIPLAVGANTITVRVTAQDGVTSRAYTVIVTRAASAVADLANLTVSSGSLVPQFQRATTAYIVTVPHATTVFAVTPTLVDQAASVKINGVMVDSGTASGPMPLQVGSNVVTVTVTAEDGSVKSYVLTVNRRLPAPANLKVGP